MWRKIERYGYAYEYSIIPRPNEAIISLNLNRSVNLPVAYKKTKGILVSID